MPVAIKQDLTNRIRFSHPYDYKLDRGNRNVRLIEAFVLANEAEIFDTFYDFMKDAIKNGVTDISIKYPYALSKSDSRSYDLALLLMGFVQEIRYDGVRCGWLFGLRYRRERLNRQIECLQKDKVPEATIRFFTHILKRYHEVHNIPLQDLSIEVLRQFIPQYEAFTESLVPAEYHTAQEVQIELQNSMEAHHFRIFHGEIALSPIAWQRWRECIEAEKPFVPFYDLAFLSSHISDTWRSELTEIVQTALRREKIYSILNEENITAAETLFSDAKYRHELNAIGKHPRAKTSIPFLLALYRDLHTSQELSNWTGDLLTFINNTLLNDDYSHENQRFDLFQENFLYQRNQGASCASAFLASWPLLVCLRDIGPSLAWLQFENANLQRCFDAILASAANEKGLLQESFSQAQRYSFLRVVSDLHDAGPVTDEDDEPKLEFNL